MRETETLAAGFVQRIADEARSIVACSTGRLLVLAWADDGVYSANLFHERLADQTIDFHFGSMSLIGLVSKFREIPTSANPQRWSGFALFIDSEDFSIEFFYQKIGDSFDPFEFRNHRVHSYFGDLPVRYPQRT